MASPKPAAQQGGQQTAPQQQDQQAPKPGTQQQGAQPIIRAPIIRDWASI